MIAVEKGKNCYKLFSEIKTKCPVDDSRVEREQWTRVSDKKNELTVMCYCMVHTAVISIVFNPVAKQVCQNQLLTLVSTVLQKPLFAL